MKKNNKKTYVTFLSVFSTLAVIVLHTNGCFWNFSTDRYWLTANIIESIFYFAVPIFFMITGVTLINYREKYSTKEFFKKRIVKTLIPFFVWSIIGILYRIYYCHDTNIILNFKSIFNGIFGTSFVQIYWFFIPLFMIYLTIPIISTIEKSKRNKIFLYIVVISFILNSVLPLINSIFSLELNLPIKLIIGTEYLSYALIGYLIDNNEIEKKKKIVIYIFGIIGLLVHIMMTYILSTDIGAVNTMYKGYNNVPCILYSTAVFIFFKDIFIKIKNKKAVSIISFIGNYTFAIYLMHFYIMEIITNFFKFSRLSIIYRLGMPFIIASVCILITWLLRKIPLIKHIVP